MLCGKKKWYVGPTSGVAIFSKGLYLLVRSSPGLAQGTRWTQAFALPKYLIFGLTLSADFQSLLVELFSKNSYFHPTSQGLWNRSRPSVWSVDHWHVARASCSEKQHGKLETDSSKYSSMTLTSNMLLDYGQAHPTFLPSRFSWIVWGLHSPWLTLALSLLVQGQLTKFQLIEPSAHMSFVIISSLSINRKCDNHQSNVTTWELGCDT